MKAIAADKWAEFKTKRKAKMAEEAEQLHMQVQLKDINEINGHQDDEEDRFVLFQAADKDKPIVKEPVCRETLTPTYLYLDSLSSYHQVFMREHLKHVKQVGVTLRGMYNAGVIHDDKKCQLLDMFYVWLVEHGIANLLSIPTLEQDGHKVTYDTKAAWKLYTPSGLILTFKNNEGVCEGFPYIDLENLQDHVKCATGVLSDQSLKIKLLGMVTFNRDKPKKKACVLTQTVHKNMEGFTQHQVKAANLACQAQSILAHPSDGEYGKMVSGPSGISNIPTIIFTAKINC